MPKTKTIILKKDQKSDVTIAVGGGFEQTFKPNKPAEVDEKYAKIILRSYSNFEEVAESKSALPVSEK